MIKNVDKAITHFFCCCLQKYLHLWSKERSKNHGFWKNRAWLPPQILTSTFLCSKNLVPNCMYTLL